MNVTHIQSEQFQASFKHRLPLSVWEASRAAPIFYLFIYLFSLLLLCCETLSAPGPSKGQWFVDVSGICDIEWFNLATRECIKQWAACKIIYCSYFILGLLRTALAPVISPSTASNGTAAESQWLYSWYGLDLLCRVQTESCVDQCRNEITPNENSNINSIQQVLKRHTMIRLPSRNSSQNLTMGKNNII